MSQSNDKGHRVKVRIIGYHPWDNNELPENDLPWAEVLSNPSDRRWCRQEVRR